jgi:hypothetical protein
MPGPVGDPVRRPRAGHWTSVPMLVVDEKQRREGEQEDDGSRERFA